MTPDLQQLALDAAKSPVPPLFPLCFLSVSSVAPSITLDSPSDPLENPLLEASIIA